jgi:hypothetical protein
MRTDPRKACANAEERWFWAFVHDGICHPLMALTNWARWSMRFHDWTSTHAWPRVELKQSKSVRVLNRKYGVLTVKCIGCNVYSVQHPAIRHRVHTMADDALGAVEIAEKWFDSLNDVGIYADGVRKTGGAA